MLCLLRHVLLVVVAASPPPPPTASSSLSEISRVIGILSRRTKNNPVLIGEPGVGKTAIAEVWCGDEHFFSSTFVIACVVYVIWSLCPFSTEFHRVCFSKSHLAGCDAILGNATRFTLYAELDDTCTLR
jgi:hypothetical protein